MPGMQPPLFARLSPFVEVETDGDSRSAVAQLPLVISLQGIRFIIFLLTTSALTSILPAREFGLLMAAGVPVAIATLLGDMGFGDGIVRCRVVSPALTSLLLYVNLVVAAFSAALMFGLTPLFEWWFSSSSLKSIVAAFGLVAILSGVAAQYRALIRRQLRLASLEANDLVVTISASLTSVFFAFYGAGAVAIPIGRAVGVLIEILGLVWLTKWIPGRPSRLREAKEVSRFGVRLMLSGVVHFGASAVITMVLGRVFSVELLGFLERAVTWSKGIVERLSPLCRRFLFSLLGRRFQISPAAAARLGSSLVKLSTLIWVPVVGSLSVVAGDFVVEALGEEWEKLASLMPWAVFGLALWLPLQAASALMLAYGMAGLLLKANLAMALVRIAIAVAAFWIGLLGFVAVTAVAEVAFSAILVAMIAKETNIGGRSWLLVIVKSSLIAAVFGACALMAGREFRGNAGILLWFCFSCMYGVFLSFAEPALRQRVLTPVLLWIRRRSC